MYHKFTPLSRVVANNFDCSCKTQRYTKDALVLFKSTGSQTSHNLLLKNKKENKHRQDGDHCACHLHIVCLVTL